MKSLPISIRSCRWVAAFLTALSASACTDNTPPGPSPDLILHNGKVITADREFSVREAIAIRDDRIVGVGSNADINEWRNADTRIIDLDGRTVIPGLIDSHIHADGYGLHITQHVMFSTGERLTVGDMLSRIKEHAATKSPGKWIYVRGPYSLDFVAEGRLPTRAELDAVSPDNPVFINMQGHVGVVNSRAIELSGVTNDTPNPPNGVFVRDPDTGELTGTLYEFPAFVPFLRHYPGHPIEERMNAINSAEAVFGRLGITSVVNLWTARDDLAALRKMAEAGELDTRWAVALKMAPDDYRGKTYSQVEKALLSYWRSSLHSDDWLTVVGIKIIFDGFAEAAYMHRPYLEEKFGPGWQGVAFWDRQSLTQVLQVCADHDIQVYVHVAGDAALDTVLDVMQEINDQSPLRGRRWTLEHANVMPSQDNLQATGELGLVVSTQQSMGWSIGKTFKKYWGRELGATFAPNRTWLENLGHPFLKAGSDNRPVDPFIGFWSYLAREDVDGDVGKPDEILSRQDVLRLYTANGAYGIFREDQLGSIEPGKLADLVILSDDILNVPTSSVRTIRPIMTIVAGQITYQADRKAAASDRPVHRD